MPYHMSWYIEQQVARVCFSGDITEVDLIDSSEDLYNLMSQAENPIHILYDGIGILDYPRSIPVIKRALRNFCIHPAMGWLVFTGFHTPELRYVSNAMMQVMMRNFKHAHSLEDVDLILQQIDPTLEIPFAHTV